MLARSKRAPLRVAAFTLHYTTLAESLKLVLQELPRIEAFELRYCEQVGDGVELGSCAPLLRSLVVTGRGIIPYYMPTEWSIASSMEKVEMPKLACLDLRESHVLWTSPLFRPTLTRLVFHGTHAQYRNIDFSQVLHVLENMPLLEDLDLSGVLPVLTSDEPTLPELDYYVSFPALKRFSIVATARSCAFLLHHTEFSVSCLQVECKVATSADLKILAPILMTKVRRLGSASALPFRSVLLTGNGIIAWSEVHSLESLPKTVHLHTPEARPRLSLTLPAILTESIFDMLVELPLEQVQTCMISSWGRGTKSQWWQKLFRGMPDVRELAVFEDSGGILHALSQRIAVSTGLRKGRKGKQRKSNVLLPNLKVMALYGVRFREYSDELREGSLLARYEKMLAVRKKAQREVKKLSIHDSINFGPEDYKLLEGMVKKLTWDGLEDWDEGDTELDTDFYSDEDGFPMHVLGHVEDDFGYDYDYPW